jgi:hypothetical protein
VWDHPIWTLAQAAECISVDFPGFGQLDAPFLDSSKHQSFKQSPAFLPQCSVPPSAILHVSSNELSLDQFVIAIARVSTSPISEVAPRLIFFLFSAWLMKKIQFVFLERRQEELQFKHEMLMVERQREGLRAQISEVVDEDEQFWRR